MVLFFNLDTLEQDTHGDPEYLVQALYKFYKGKRIPKHNQEQYPPLKRLRAGNSFLLNPEDFFKNTTVDSPYRAQYIRLAGRRDYQHFKHYGLKSLDLTLYPDINYQVISTNPLLTIANNQIYFKYEE